jgi:hypothetical protein
MPDRVRRRARTAAELAAAPDPLQLKAAFLAALAETANISEACRRTGAGRRTAYDWREADSEFAKGWDDALETGTDALEGEARRRAIEGVERYQISGGKVVEYGGKPVTIREFSDNLLIALLKAHRPDKFRDNARVEMTGAGGGPIKTEDVIGMEAARRIAFALAKAAESLPPDN